MRVLGKKWRGLFVHWIHSLNAFLSDGLAAFRAFLKSEFCEENIEFWLACEDFKKTKSPQKLSSKAKKIYTDFIEKEAPKEVSGGGGIPILAYFEHSQHQSETRELKKSQIKRSDGGGAEIFSL